MNMLVVPAAPGAAAGQIAVERFSSLAMSGRRSTLCSCQPSLARNCQWAQGFGGTRQAQLRI